MGTTTQYARSLLEASLDPFVVISADGKITDVNEASVKVTGIPREKMIGSNFSNYFTEPKKAHEGYLQVFEKDSVVNYQLTIKHKNGKLTDVLYNASVYKDDKGKVLGIFAAARDVTEQKRISRELSDAKMIAEGAKIKAEEATRIAEDEVKSKQQFLANMSHEIRTPMTAIIGFTKLLLKTDMSKKQKEYLSAINTSGNALIVLINDILDLAKVNAGKISFEQIPFKIAQSISAMLFFFETKALEKGIKLVKEYDNKIPEVLIGDPARLHQIVLNLLSNSLKFTTKGEITVSAHLLNEDEKKVTLEFMVTDTGIGMSKEGLENIFKNFQQAKSNTARLFGGTGLGLAIVKQLVERQGGSLRVESEIGKGSTFSFILSFQKTKNKVELETAIVELDPEIKGIKVLVVEDNLLNQLLIRLMLDDFGFEHDIAADGKIAIEKLQTKSYDIILMDIQMPVMNGLEATNYIRNTLNSKIPIIAISADVTSEEIETSKAVGMNDHVAKPIDEKLLYSKIVGLVKKSN